MPTYEVFPTVKSFAADLRSEGVPNHWIAYTGHWNKTNFSDFKSGKMSKGRFGLSRDLAFYPNMGIQDADFVFEKANQWAFRSNNCPLSDHLNEHSQNVLIMDGVKDKHCYAGSIETGLKRDFRIYAVLNATNCPDDQHEEYAKWFLRPNDLTPEQKACLTFTSTDEVISALQYARHIKDDTRQLAHG